ncbi:MAG: hypothetical protein GX567_06715 [Clostridia bacterium]|nr:hypothetical protein [Clostridia bacterium]
MISFNGCDVLIARRPEEEIFPRAEFRPSLLGTLNVLISESIIAISVFVPPISIPVNI